MTSHGKGRRDRNAMLREARRRLARLEDEARQIGATLACMESAEVDAVVPACSQAIGASRLPHAARPPRPSTAAVPDTQVCATGSTAVDPVLLATAAVAGGQPRARSGHARLAPALRAPSGARAAKTNGAKRAAEHPVRPAARQRPVVPTAWLGTLPGRLRLLPSWLVSLAVHVALLGVLACLTIAALPNARPVLQVSLRADQDPTLEELSPVRLEPADCDEVTPDDRLIQIDQLLPESFDLGPLEPARELAGIVPDQAERPIGPGLDRTTAATGLGRGRRAGRGPAAAAGTRGGTSFFGTPARADRIVFLVDNSNSMADGRFETALMELSRSVEMMVPKQRFHVMFYSDDVYRMFHPQPAAELIPATRPNKQRVHAWLPTAEMCRGGCLIDAMQVAEKMEPQVVYLLSDGVIGDYPLKCLTQPERPDIVIHTIGMTVPNAEAGQKLQAIAAANHGIFRPVGVNLLARRMARHRPIRRNRERGPVWGISLPGE